MKAENFGAERPQDRFERAIQLIDEANSQDPNQEIYNGQPYPKELLYSIRMTEWLERLQPNAPEAVRLAARSQHVCRWMIPRDDYPKDRLGYLSWRTHLYSFHAEKAAEILTKVGYDAETIQRVKKMLLKRGLRRDPDVQLIEDIACLVFIESYFLDFAKDYDEEKLISIVQKTWKKMSEQARQAALELDLPESARELIQKALA